MKPEITGIVSGNCSGVVKVPWGCVGVEDGRGEEGKAAAACDSDGDGLLLVGRPDDGETWGDVRGWGKGEGLAGRGLGGRFDVLRVGEVVILGDDLAGAAVGGLLTEGDSPRDCRAAGDGPCDCCGCFDGGGGEGEEVLTKLPAPAGKGEGLDDAAT